MKLKAYNLLTWVNHLFLFYQERVFRKLLPIISIITIYAVAIVYIDRNSGFLQKMINPSLGQFHLMFSFVLTIIISFRVNSSYARWWEGRTLWGGIVNNCRNLGLKFDVFAGLANHPEFYSLLHRLPVLIKANLRKNKETLALELQALNIDNYSTQPVLLVIKKMYMIINQLRDEKKIRWEQYTALDQHLATLIDLIGGCERIANTPIPPAFAIFIKQALLFYSLIFPFGWVDPFGFFIIPIMIMAVYILLGLEILSEELEAPFEADENRLRLDVISRNLADNIVHIAGYGTPDMVKEKIRKWESS